MTTSQPDAVTMLATLQAKFESFWRTTTDLLSSDQTNTLSLYNLSHAGLPNLPQATGHELIERAIQESFDHPEQRTHLDTLSQLIKVKERECYDTKTTDIKAQQKTQATLHLLLGIREAIQVYRFHVTWLTLMNKFKLTTDPTLDTPTLLGQFLRNTEGFSSDIKNLASLLPDAPQHFKDFETLVKEALIDLNESTGDSVKKIVGQTIASSSLKKQLPATLSDLIRLLNDYKNQMMTWFFYLISTEKSKLNNLLFRHCQKQQTTILSQAQIERGTDLFDKMGIAIAERQQKFVEQYLSLCPDANVRSELEHHHMISIVHLEHMLKPLLKPFGDITSLDSSISQLLNKEHSDMIGSFQKHAIQKLDHLENTNKQPTANPLVVDPHEDFSSLYQQCDELFNILAFIYSLSSEDLDPHQSLPCIGTTDCDITIPSPYQSIIKQAQSTNVAYNHFTNSTTLKQPEEEKSAGEVIKYVIDNLVSLFFSPTDKNTVPNKQKPRIKYTQDQIPEAITALFQLLSRTFDTWHQSVDLINAYASTDYPGYDREGVKQSLEILQTHLADRHEDPTLQEIIQTILLNLTDFTPGEYCSNLNPSENMIEKHLELIDDRKTELISRYNSYDELSEKLKKFIQDHQEELKLDHSLKDDIIELFTPDAKQLLQPLFNTLAELLYCLPQSKPSTIGMLEPSKTSSVFSTKKIYSSSVSNAANCTRGISKSIASTVGELPYELKNTFKEVGPGFQALGSEMKNVAFDLRDELKDSIPNVKNSLWYILRKLMNSPINNPTETDYHTTRQPMNHSATTQTYRLRETTAPINLMQNSTVNTRTVISAKDCINLHHNFTTLVTQMTRMFASMRAQGHRHVIAGLQRFINKEKTIIKEELRCFALFRSAIARAQPVTANVEAFKQYQVAMQLENIIAQLSRYTSWTTTDYDNNYGFSSLIVSFGTLFQSINDQKLTQADLGNIFTLCGTKHLSSLAHQKHAATTAFDQHRKITQFVQPNNTMFNTRYYQKYGQYPSKNITIQNNLPTLAELQAQLLENLKRGQPLAQDEFQQLIRQCRAAFKNAQLWQCMTKLQHGSDSSLASTLKQAEHDLNRTFDKLDYGSTQTKHFADLHHPLREGFDKLYGSEPPNINHLISMYVSSVPAA